jgi:AcrR family transcriptional regulator
MAYHHGDLRNTLVTEGRRLLREVGPTKLSLRALARRVGVSHTAAYRHFADKEALLEAVAVAGFEALTSVTRAAAAGGADPLAGLADTARAYVRFAQKDPETFRLMFQRVGARPAQAVAAASAFAVLEGLVTSGQAAGVLRAGDPFAMALTMWSAVHGAARLVVDEAAPPGSGDAEALVMTVAVGMLQGIGAR